MTVKRASIALLALAVSGCTEPYPMDQEKVKARAEIFATCIREAKSLPYTYESDPEEVIQACGDQSYYITNTK